MPFSQRGQRSRGHIGQLESGGDLRARRRGRQHGVHGLWRRLRRRLQRKRTAFHSSTGDARGRRRLRGASRLSEKGQAILDLVLFICFYAPGVFALTYAGYFYAKKAWIVHETSWNSPAQIQIYFSKSLIPIAGLLLLIIGISEIFRCIICIKTGKWPERIDDVEETEKMILRKIQKGENVKGLVS